MKWVTEARKFSSPGQDRNAYKVLAGKLEGRIPLVGPLGTFGSGVSHKRLQGCGLELYGSDYSPGPGCCSRCHERVIP